MASRKHRPAHRQTVAPLSHSLLTSAALGLLMACAAATARAESTTVPAAEPTTDPAAAPSTDPTIAGSLERHFTNNALDSDRNVSDWYTQLRGTLQKQWGDNDAYARSMRTSDDGKRVDECRCWLKGRRFPSDRGKPRSASPGCREPPWRVFRPASPTRRALRSAPLHQAQSEA